MRGPGAANAATSPARGRASPGARRRRWASSASRSMPACGRRRCISRAPRRRSSTCSQARASPCSGRARATRSATRCAPGDCLVHLALDSAHTLQAGPDGLDVLAFGQRTFANGITWLPRAGVAWLGETWAPVGAEEDHPWTREAAAGPPEVSELSPRPSSIVHIADLESCRARRCDGRTARPLSGARGGLRAHRASVTPRSSPASSTPRPTATLPRRRSSSSSRVTATSCSWGSERGRQSIRFAPAPSSRARRARASRTRSEAASDGMTLLDVRNPRSREVCYYPRSGKVFFIGPRPHHARWASSWTTGTARI